MATLTQPLRFGISLPNRAVLFGVPPETLLEAAQDAEASGLFDSVWVGDNFLSKPRLESVVTLAALAARTKRLKLGTICLASFPLRHPLPFAIQWASLDVLSGGRTVLVVCNGGSSLWGGAYATELAAMKVKSSERASRVEEGITVLRKFFGPNPVTHHGQFYDFEDVQVLPKPVQERVPIGIAVKPVPGDAASEERILRRVARLADCWQMDSIDPVIFRGWWDRVREYAAEYGRAAELTDTQLHMMVNINDDADRAREESVAFLAHYYGEGTISEEYRKHWLAFGSPAAVIEKIHTFIEAGFTTPVLRFTSPDQRGQLERCVTDVLPSFGAFASS